MGKHRQHIARQPANIGLKLIDPKSEETIYLKAVNLENF